MARIVDNPEFWGGYPQPRRKKRFYPWGEWSDGKWREALRGEDFDCQAQSFATAVYHHAEKYGKLSTTYVDGNAVLFRILVEVE